MENINWEIHGDVLRRRLIPGHFEFVTKQQVQEIMAGEGMVHKFTSLKLFVLTKCTCGINFGSASLTFNRDGSVRAGWCTYFSPADVQEIRKWANAE